jgi:hypothetical protein
MPNEETKQQTGARPNRYISRDDDQKAVWALRGLHTYKNAAHDQAPLEESGTPDEMPLARLSCFSPFQRTFGFHDFIKQSNVLLCGGPGALTVEMAPRSQPVRSSYELGAPFDEMTF